MDNNKFMILFTTRRVFWILVILSFVTIGSLAMSQYQLGAVSSIAIAIIFVFQVRARNSMRADFENYMENLAVDIESASKNVMLTLAIPILVADLNGEIVWQNAFFSGIFDANMDENEVVKEIVDKFNSVENKSGAVEIRQEISIGERHFVVVGRVIEKFGARAREVLLLYFIEDTEEVTLKRKFVEERPVVGVIMIDNYDDLMQNVIESKIPILLAEIDSKIVSWTQASGGIIRKYDRDKYLYIFHRKHLKEFEEKRFDILEQVKEVNNGNKIPVTISIGIDNSADSLAKSYNLAMASLEIALGRGGDQIVIKNGDNIQFFGGKSREIEKRTKVKARVIAHALKEIITQSTQIIIMGHSNCDVDCLGASVGIYKIARSINREAYIVLDTSNPTINPFIEKISKISEYDGVFISKTQAIDLITKNTLLVVVDTHRPIYTECPELLKYTHNVVVIDHHRRGAEFIQDAVLTYQEPYASSTCELVTEIIQYIEESVKIGDIEAELLYSGIVVDTKGFIFKTGVRTFEAAAYLRKKGVDTIEVKQLLQNDLESFINISNIVREVKLVYNSMAISVCPPKVKNSALVAAQAADQILGIAGIGAAFVVTDTGNGIFISGRSLGEINVQIILEKIGGGGHQTVAGAQFYNIPIDEVVSKLKVAIEAYLKEITKES